MKRLNEAELGPVVEQPSSAMAMATSNMTNGTVAVSELKKVYSKNKHGRENYVQS